MYYCSFSGRYVMVIDAKDNRQVRKISFPSNVISAQMSGENFVVQTEDRYTYLYALDGRQIRKVRN